MFRHHVWLFTCVQWVRYRLTYGSLPTKGSSSDKRSSEVNWTDCRSDYGTSEPLGQSECDRQRWLMIRYLSGGDWHSDGDLFIVIYLSRFCAAYNDSHWKAAKRVLRYLTTTMNKKLTYFQQPEGSPLTLITYSDSDWANQLCGIPPPHPPLGKMLPRPHVWDIVAWEGSNSENQVSHIDPENPDWSNHGLQTVNDWIHDVVIWNMLAMQPITVLCSNENRRATHNPRASSPLIMSIIIYAPRSIRAIQL